MMTENPKRLPENLNLPCFSCEKAPSTHVCRFKVGELVIQMCLCGTCMQMDSARLLQHVIDPPGAGVPAPMSEAAG